MTTVRSMNTKTWNEIYELVGRIQDKAIESRDWELRRTLTQSRRFCEIFRKKACSRDIERCGDLTPTIVLSGYRPSVGLPCAHAVNIKAQRSSSPSRRRIIDR
jgi:hypothetical protein